ncbi:hypothetical protein [Kitasatospora sp. NBC_01266]|uniref:hypothetical protein n=1 Tax=Kitasatospora sp. NBC_01266 TaxID=2903572 RepID=UPI002E3797C7|nr:hypothetical protein [Kitasatospora sp. NBC_01266]
MTHNDVARVLAPRTLAARPLSRRLACECPQLPAGVAVRALTRELTVRGLSRPTPS